MQPDSPRCSGCAREHHSWGVAATDAALELPAGAVRLTRRSCACPRCACRDVEVTLSAVARARPAHAMADNIPTEYLALAGFVNAKENTDMMQTPTVPKYTLPDAAFRASGLRVYVPPAVPLAPSVEPLVQTQAPPLDLQRPEIPFMKRVLKKLRELPTTGPGDIPPHRPTQEPPT